MVRIEPCATTVRSGHVVVRKKRRSSMARLKEAASSLVPSSSSSSSSFLLLLLFCENLSSTGLKRQREREKRNLFSDHLPSLSLSKVPSKKLSSLRGRKEKFFLCHDKWINNGNGNNNNKQEDITNRNFRGNIYVRRWMWVVVDGWPRVEGNLIFYLIGRMEEFIYPRGPFCWPFPFVIL